VWGIRAFALIGAQVDMREARHSPRTLELKQITAHSTRPALKQKLR
jgi:hypothetical protein